VGTIVIGQAAVAAGLVSPLMVIITSLSAMASFAVPDYTLMNPIRILKFMLIILTGIFGLYGLIMGLTLILINLVSTSSFGVPYTATYAPFHLKDFINSLFSDINLAKYRPEYLKTRNKKRR